MNIDKDKIKNIIEELLRNRYLSETRWITLKTENNKIWALVIAWQDGFDNKPKSNNRFIFGTYRICGKIAYNDSYMKDYDIDWLMPINESTNDIYDTETSLEHKSDIDDAISYWEKCWIEIEKSYIT